MATEIFDLIPKDINLFIVPVRRTVKYKDEDGVERKKRNQIALNVHFKGVYENTFPVGVGFRSVHGHMFIAVSPHELRLISPVCNTFALPVRIFTTFSAYIENPLE